MVECVSLAANAVGHTHAHWHITYKVHQALDLCGYPHLKSTQSLHHWHGWPAKKNKSKTTQSDKSQAEKSMKAFSNSANKSICIYLSLPGVHWKHVWKRAVHGSLHINRPLWFFCIWPKHLIRPVSYLRVSFAQMVVYYMKNKSARGRYDLFHSVKVTARPSWETCRTAEGDLEGASRANFSIYKNAFIFVVKTKWFFSKNWHKNRYVCWS